MAPGDSELQYLAERVEQLEKESYRFKLGVGFFLLAISIIMLFRALIS
jgi:hypothetical protein